MNRRLLLLAALVALPLAALAQRPFAVDPKAPRGKLNAPFSVGQARLTAKNLRILNHPDAQPPKGTFFIAFDLTIENRSAGSVVRMQTFFEGLMTPQGKPIAAGSGLNAMVDEAILALPQRPDGSPAGGDVEVKAGQTATLTIAKTVPVGTRQAIFAGMLGFQKSARPQMDYKIDLSPLPAYTPPTDVTVPSGQPINLNGIEWRVLGAVRDNTQSETEKLLGALGGGKEASEGEKALLGLFGGAPSGNPNAKKPAAGPKVKIKVTVGARNGTEKSWEPGMNSVTLEDAEGRTYGPDILAGGMIPPLRPGESGERGYIFKVPQSVLRGLRVRLNPARGHGRHVIPLTL